MKYANQNLLAGAAGLGWAVGCSRQGASHLRVNQRCQDSLAIWSGAAAGSPCLIAAVADGHGDVRHDLSHLGAAFAVRAAVDELLSLFTHSWQEQGPLACCRSFKADFPRRVGRRWRQAVLADARNRADEEPPQRQKKYSLKVRYGTTLLAALVTEHTVHLAQLGDGAVFLIRPAGGIEAPLLSAATAIGPATNSLCSAGAPNLIQTAVLDRAEGGLLFLATDGLVNAFPDDEEMHKFALSLQDRFQEYGLTRVVKSLPGWLDRCSSEGSGDDITLALTAIHPSPEGEPTAITVPQREVEEKKHASCKEPCHDASNWTASTGREVRNRSDREEEAGRGRPGGGLFG
jgi:serine/threonine protein phosphatase PrpC